MYILTGFVFLGAFTAFASGQTCGEIMNCLKLADDVQKATATGNVKAQCPIQKQMIDCFSSALADCQNAGSGPSQEDLNQFETSLSETRKNYDNVCAGNESSSSAGSSGGNTGVGDGSVPYNTGSEGSIPLKASCSEAGKCVFDFTELQNAIKESNMDKVCNIINPSAKCLRSAFEDCQANNVLPENQLQEMSVQVTQVEDQLGQYCNGGMSVSVGAGGGSAVDGSQSVSCADAITCTPDSDKLVDAITNGRHDEACEILTKSYNCLQSAVEDCKAKNLLSGPALESIEESYKSYEPQIAQYCEAPTGEVHCMDSATCVPDTDRLTKALNDKSFEEACQILTTANDCLQSAVDDCKARGVMSEEDLKSMQDIQKSYLPQIEQLCQVQGNGQEGGVSCLQMQSCMPEGTLNKVNKSVENHQFEEACKLMTPVMECQTSALEDCQRRGIMDSITLKQVEEGVETAKVEMKKYCSSGNSASTSMHHFLAATLLVFLINFFTSRE